MSELPTRVLTCDVCSNTSNNTVVTIREMMQGSRTPFEYIECGRCGCLHLDPVPDDLSQFYASDYYSLATRTRSPFKGRVRKARDSSAVGSRPNLLGAALCRLSSPPPYVEWLERSHTSVQGRILDVGAGTGGLVFRMADAGMRNVSGIEPNLPSEMLTHGDATVWRRYLSEVEESYDLIMFHHSFEHLPNPLEELACARTLINGSGCVLIRLPVMGTFAWRKYGTSWVQLDAPRHVTLQTEESLGLLADRAGFAVTDSVYDSTEFQFWGSDLYERDIPLSTRSVRDHRASLRRKDLRAMRALAAQLNAARDGDQAAFYLTPV
jgi:SAM-dependent methyltransferase